MAWIGKYIDSRHHEPCEFSEQYYVGDGRTKGVDARANARVCPGYASGLTVLENGPMCSLLLTNMS